MAFNVVFEQSAIDDLDNAIAYHLKQSVAKAKRLDEEVAKAVAVLEHNPWFAVRYDGVSCLPLGKKLTYMLQFTVDEANQMVYVFALFNTLQNPEKYPKY